MKKRASNASLLRFVKAECANIDTYYGGCLFRDTCLVLDGKPCAYFEKSVLGPPDYKYPLPGYDYPKLFSQYAEINKAFKSVDVEVRKCECGKRLKPRQRYCEKCIVKRRRKTYRESQQSSRLDVNS